MYLAMDGPVLVPCETLDPIRPTRKGSLPPQCAQLAMIYYALLFVSSLSTLITLPRLTFFHIDCTLWLETSIFSFFWSFLVIEMLMVFISTLYVTVRNKLQNYSLIEIASDLFPTVEAASVDDYVYKSQTGGFE